MKQPKKIFSKDGAPMLSARAAAARLDCAQDYIGKLCREGKLEGTQLNGAWFVSEASIGIFEKQREQAKLQRSEELSQERRKEQQAHEFATRSAFGRILFRAKSLIPETPHFRSILPLVLVSVAVGLLLAGSSAMMGGRSHDIGLSAALAQVESPFFGTGAQVSIGNLGAWFAKLFSRQTVATNVQPQTIQSPNTTVAVAPQFPQPTAPTSATVIEPARTYTQPQSVIQNTYPIRERVVERVVYEGGVTQELLSASLQQLGNQLRSELYVSLNNVSGPPASGGVVNNIALTQRIDKLDGVTITNSSIGGYLPLTGGTVESFAVSGTGTSTFAGGLAVTGGCVSVNGTCLGTGGGGAGNPGGSDTQVQFNDAGSFNGDSGFVYNKAADRLTLTFASTTALSTGYASSTNLFAGTLTLGSALAVGSGGTGIASAPSYGQLLVGNSSGSYTLMGTSSLGIVSFSTTSVDYWKSQTNFFSTTSADYYVTASSTIVKTNVDNTFAGTQRFTTASTTNLTISSLGASAGQCLTVNSSGTVSAVNCGSAAGFAFTPTTNYNTTVNATSTPVWFQNGLFASSTSQIAYASTTALSATIGYFGTASTSNLTISDVPAALLSTGASGAVQSAVIAAPLSFSGGTLSITQSGSAQNGYLSSADWNTFNNKISSTSLSAGAGISYNASTGVITNLIGYPFLGNATSTQIAFNGGLTAIGATTTALTVTGSTTISGAFNATGNSLFGNATTTAFAITGVPSALLKTLASGAVVPAVAGVDYATNSSSFPFTPTAIGNSTSTLLQLNAGVIALASSTIGNGAQAGGLTILGGATTTGLLVVQGAGTSTISGDLSIGGALGISGNIIPSANNVYTLGSPARMWKDAYIGPGSLYINGQQVLSTNGTNDIVLSSDPNENIIVQTSGTANIELNPSGTGQILLKSGVNVTAGKNITTTDSSALPIPFGVAAGNLTVSGNSITATNLNGGISLTPTGSGGVYVTTGKFGIGSTTPAQPLSVEGNTYINGSLQLTSLAGPLQAIGGVVSATGTLSIAYGGTGTSTAPSYGQLLIGNGFGGFNYVATSSLGLSASDIATGTLAVQYGGTGVSSITGIVVGNGTAPFSSITDSLGLKNAISDETGSGALVFANSPTLSGLVGIGTSTPGTVLGVQGTGFFSGNLTAAHILATGTLTAANLLSTGSTTIAGFLNAVGGGTLNITQATTSALAVTGSTTIAGALNAVGGATLGSVSAGAATLSSLAVTNGATFGNATSSGSLSVSASTTVAGALNAVGSVALGNATSSTFALTSVPSALLKTLSSGAVVAAVAGSDYLTPGALAAAFPFTPTTFGPTAANATSTLIGFTNGIYALASSTIGNGSQGGGLTISGGATTTGIAYFQNLVGIGTNAPGKNLDVAGTARVSATFTLSGTAACTGSQALQTNGSGDVVCGNITQSGASTGGGWTTDNIGSVTLATTTDRVGIGATTTPYAKLSILSGSTATTTLALVAASNQTANILDIYGAGGTLQTVLTANGFLGLGTTSPAARLSVEGSSLLGNSATAGYFVATTTTASILPYASSTAITAATGFFSTATTSALNVSGTATLQNLASALLSTGASGVVQNTTVSSPLNFAAGTLSLNIGSGLTTNGGNIILNMSSANNWLALQTFSGAASTTQLSALDALYIGRTATTTIRGDGVASTLPYASSTALSVAGAAYFNTIASTGSSTIAGVLNATGGSNFGTATGSGLFTLAGGFYSSASSTLSGAVSSTLSNYLASTTLAGPTLFGSATSTGSLYVIGSTTVGGVLNALGGAKLGSATLSGTLTLTGSTNCTGQSALQTNSSGDVACGTVSMTGISTAGGWTTNNTGTVKLATSSDVVVVGATTTAPYAKLSVVGDAAGSTTLAIIPMTSQTNNIIDIYNTSGRLTSVLTAAGNLGLGTTSPYAALSVAGASGVVANQFYATSTTATSTFAGGLNVGNGALVYDYSGGYTSIQNMILGAQSFDTDAGQVSWVDMPVTANASAGTVESYTAQLGGTQVLTVYSESNGSGGVRNTRVGVGTTTPYAKFTVWGDSAGAASTTLEVANSASTTLFSIKDSGTAYFVGTVGIGTTSPYAALSVVGASGIVAGSINATSTTVASSFQNISLASATSTGSLSVTGSTTIAGNFNALGTVALGTLTAGATTLSGALSLGSNNITNVGTVTATSFTTTAAGTILWSGRSTLASGSDGVITLSNNAQNDFTRLTFGGTTASYPALGRSGTGLNLILADGTLGGKLGISTTSVAGKLAFHANAGESYANNILFAVGSSTASATTTLFSIDNQGNVYSAGSYNVGSLSLNAPLAVSSGGTGANSLTGILIGNGTSPVTTITDSLGLANNISDETGTGALVFNTNPSFSGAQLNTASSTALSVLNTIYIGRTATTTINGDGVASILPYASSTAFTTTNLYFTQATSTGSLAIGASTTIAGALNVGGDATVGTLALTGTTPRSTGLYLKSIGGITFNHSGNLVGGFTSDTNYGSRLYMMRDTALAWVSNTVDSDSATDTSIKRTAAGQLEINNGTAGTYRDLILRSATTTGQTVLARDFGSVGVGTTSPARTLSVQGGGLFAGTLTGADVIATGTLSVGGAASITGAATLSSTLGVTGLASFFNASTSLFSVTGKAYFGGSATTTIDSAGNLAVAGNFSGAGLTTCASSQDKLVWTGGQFACAIDAGAAGTEFNWSFFNGSGIRLGTTSNQVLIGATATSSGVVPLAALNVIGGAGIDYATTTALFSTVASSTRLFTSSFGVATSSMAPSTRVGISGGNLVLAAGGAPAIASTTKTTKAYQTAVVGTIAYVADYSAGLRIMDVSNPRVPSTLGTYSAISTAVSVVAAGRYAYVGDTATGISILDVSNPSNPTLVGSYSLGFPYSLALSGKYLYAPDYNAGTVSILDVSDPRAPKLAGTYTITSGAPYGIVVAGKYLYVADQGTSKVYIVDVSNPSAPATVGSYATIGTPSGMYVSGKNLYVADQGTGLYVLDVANPASPRLVGTFHPNTTDNFYGVSVAGDYAYVADHGGSVVVLDVSSTSPRFVASTTIGVANGVVVSGKYAYVASDTSGVSVIDINGAQLPAASIGALATNQLNVADDLVVGNNIYAGAGLDVGIAGIFSRGTISAFIASTTQTNPVVANFMGGNVGIGTSTLATTLGVHGSALISGNLTAANITATGTITTANLTTTGLFSSTNASTSLLSVFTKAYFGGTATSTFDSTGALDIAGTASIKQNGTTVLNASSTTGSTFVGPSTGNLSHTGTNNVAVGKTLLGALTSGTGNVAVGFNSLTGNTTGANNIAIGEAANSNTTGSHNIALGKWTLGALAGPSTGDLNIAIGYASLSRNTSGNSNLALGGINTLPNNTTGAENIALGSNALYNNISGSYNVAIGSNSASFGALAYSRTGSNNVAVGTQASFQNVSATNTVAVGTQTAYGDGGVFNAQGYTTLGYRAGYNFQTGSDYNTLLGYQAGYNITTGANNVIVGGASTAANDNLTTGSGNIKVGYNISFPSATANNQLNIGNLIYGTNLDGSAKNYSTGQIGIGSTSPFARFSINANNGDTNLFAFAIGSSTASATTTLVSVTNTGITTINTDANVGNTANIFNVQVGGTNKFKVVGNGNGVLGGNYLAFNNSNPGSLVGDYLQVDGASLFLIVAGSTAAADFYAGRNAFNSKITFTNGAAYNSSDTGIYRLAASTLGFGSATAGNYGGSLAAGAFGVGTTTPWAPLSLAIASSSTYQTLFAIASTSNSGATSTLFIIRNDGNVGIGTTSPYAKLSISANNGETNRTLFAVASSTSATTTTFGTISNTGVFSWGADGSNLFSVDAVTGTTTIANLALGNLSFDTNAGVVTLSDIPVDSNAAAGVVQSQAIAIGGTPILVAYGESDGAGSTQNLRGAVGTSTPYAKLTVWGDNVTAGSKVFEIVNNASTTLLSVDGIGKTTLLFASSTALTATNLFAGNATTTGSLAVTGSSTVAGVLNAVGGLNTGALTATGLFSSQNASTSLLSVFTKAYFGGTSTTTIDSAGNINMPAAAAIYESGTKVFQASTTLGNTAVGPSAGGTAATVTGSYNTAAGISALSSVTSGTQHTALGYQAVFSNSTGSGNTGVGAAAMVYNLGSYNTAVGAHSQRYSRGNFSTSLGYMAMNASSNLDSTGTHNTAAGYTALFSYTTGSSNSVFGSQAAYSNITGSDNAALGVNALYYNGSATNTVAIGSQAAYGNGALYSNQGSVAVGYSAGYKFGTGSNYNTLVGYQSGYNITTGANNILVGASPTSANDNLTTGSGNIKIGYNISLPSATANNQLNIGNLLFGTNLDGAAKNYSSGQLGVGSTSPFARLSVHANNGDINTTLFAIGSSTATATTTLLSVNNVGQTVINTASALGSSALLFDVQSNGSSAFKVDKSANVTIGSSGSPNVLVNGGGMFGWSSTYGLAGAWTGSLPTFIVNNSYVSSFYSTGIGVKNSAFIGWDSTANSYGSDGSGASVDTRLYRSSAGVLSLGTSANNGVGTFLAHTIGLGTTTPYAQLSLVATSTTGTGAPTTLFAIASTTGGTSTSTLFSVSNTGDATLAGTLTVGSCTGCGGGSFPFTPTTSFGSTANSTSTLTLFTAGISASSTVRFGNAGIASQFQYDGSTGFLGLGTSSPWAQFSINPTATNGVAPSFVIASSSRTSFVVDNAGRVGVGTSTPYAMLSIHASSTPFTTLFAIASTSSIGSTTNLFSVDRVGNIGLNNNADITFGQMYGTGPTGYGLRENGGMIEFRNAYASTTLLASNWTPISSAASVRYQLNETGWVNTGAALPHTLYASQPVVIGDYVYLFGGFGGAAYSNAIWRAPVSNPTSWATTTGTLPGNLAYSQAAVIGDYVYLFGGNSGSVTNVIYRAPVSNPTSWQDTGATLPASIYISQLAVIGDYVYLFGGSGASAVDVIYRAPVSNPTSWQDTGAKLPYTLFGSQLLVIGDYAYLFGGHNGSITTNIIYRAPVSNPTSWATTTGTLPRNLVYSQAAVIGDYVYLFGGNSGSATNVIYRAPVSNPTSWQDTGAVLPSNLQLSQLAVIGDYVYLFGGHNGSITTNIIYRAPITNNMGNFDVRSWTQRLNAPSGPWFMATSSNSNISYLAGSVGIGTTSPWAQFSVFATPAASSSSNTIFAIGSSTVLGATSTLFSVNNIGNISLGGAAPTLLVPNATDQAFSIATSTSNTPAFTVSTRSSLNGLVGVGTSSPWGKFSIEMGPLNPAFVVSNLGSSSPAFYISGVNNNGYVGVGTSSPWAQFSIHAASSSVASTLFAIASTSNNGVHSTLLSFTNTGNLGLGTSSPYAVLSISASSSPASTLFVISSSTVATTTALFSVSGAGLIATNNNYFATDAVTGSTTIANLSMGNINFDTNAGVVMLADTPIDGTAATGTIQSTSIGIGGVSLLTVYSEAMGTSTQNRRVGIATTSPWAQFAIHAAIASTSSQTLFAIGSTTAAGANSTLFAVSNTGAVGIGTSTATTTLLNVGSASVSSIVASFTNGSGTCFINPTNTALSCSSDSRLKKDISSIAATTSLERVFALNPVFYNWNSEATGTPQHAGFIAQEVERIFPDLVQTDPNGYKSLNYAGLTPYLVAAVQELGSSLLDRVKTWLSDSGNGILDLFATTIHAETVYAKKLCLEDVCITKTELQSLLNGSTGSPQAAAGGSQPGGGAGVGAGDSEAPVITLNGDNPASIAVGAQYIDLGATVSDNVDQNLGYTVSLDNATSTTIDQLVLDTSTGGTHYIVFTAADQAGNTGTATRTVIVGDGTASSTQP